MVSFHDTYGVCPFLSTQFCFLDLFMGPSRNPTQS